MARFGLMAILAVASCTLLTADTLSLRDGRTLDGTLLGANTREVRWMGPDGTPRSIPIVNVARIEFSEAAPTPVAPAPTAAIPAGIEITIRMIDAIDSSTTRPGDLYDCSIDDPIVLGNQVIVPRGNDCSIQIVEAVANRELALKLYNININGTNFDVVTEYAELHSSDTGKTTKGVRRAAGLGALGAGIGAIIGGGSGAAIGAATGAGLGALSGATAKGKVLLVPSETRLTFRLREPIPLN